MLAAADEIERMQAGAENRPGVANVPGGGGVSGKRKRTKTAKGAAYDAKDEESDAPANEGGDDDDVPDEPVTESTDRDGDGDGDGDGDDHEDDEEDDEEDDDEDGETCDGDDALSTSSSTATVSAKAKPKAPRATKAKAKATDKTKTKTKAKGKGKEKAGKLSGEECRFVYGSCSRFPLRALAHYDAHCFRTVEKVIATYLKEANRPYNANAIFENLHKVGSLSAFKSALDVSAVFQVALSTC